MESRPVIIPLGGFLGAGKTTLILSASRLLQARGLKPAAILNDQGADLVDTRYVRENGIEAGQVSGGCFCCRFSDLIESAEMLRAYSPDVIFAEAVGSCTDISATTLQPLKLHHSHEFRLAPYSVLVDPAQAEALTAQDADADLAFLFRKQIEEADLVCFTKSDLHSTFPSLPAASVRYLSPFTGEGVAAWLDEILAGEIDPGNKLLEIDYERYARAEASLAWLNCQRDDITCIAAVAKHGAGTLAGRLRCRAHREGAEDRAPESNCRLVIGLREGFDRAQRRGADC